MKQSEQASADTTEHFRQEAYPLVIYNQEKNSKHIQNRFVVEILPFMLV